LGAWLYVRLIDNPMIHFIKTKMPNIDTNLNINELISTATKNGIDKAIILEQAHTNQFWLLFAAIGILAIFSLLLYQRFIGSSKH